MGHGADASLSLISWFKPSDVQTCGRIPRKAEMGKGGEKPDEFGHLAGIWSEGISAREFVLFARAPRGNLTGEEKGQGVSFVDGEVSRTGSQQQGCKWSISYALGGAKLFPNQWH